MASKLTKRDINILDANNFDIVGNKPYEDGKWGTHADRDFVHFQIFDSNNNLVQYENLPVSQFSLNVSNDNVEFYPGSHIRSLGFNSGIFTVRYNFLRKLAGDESSVLVHTVDKNNTVIGDVYTSYDKLYITEDGIIYAATERDYLDNPTTTEELAIQDLKYQIHEISPSRTEVRLQAKQINSSYIDDFVNIQTPYNFKTFENKISFQGNSFETKVLSITPEENGFIFSQQMVGGTLIIPDVYKVEEVSVPVTSGLNFIQNSSGEDVFTDNLGNVEFQGNKWGWDESLHDDAVRADNWEPGYRDNGGLFANTAHIGYHAKWVQREGIAGGNCIKFTDQNEIFVGVDNWPEAAGPYRQQAMSQVMLPIVTQGAKNNDFVNVRFDVKSTVANKGVRVIFSYKIDELETEPKPQNPPDGYFDPNNPGATEPQPTSPPDGYVANTEANAFAIEDKPPQYEDAIRAKYRQSVPTPLDLAMGESTVIWGGAGAWKVVDIKQTSYGTAEGVVIVNQYFWAPNLAANTMNGTLSSEGDWVWTSDPENPPYSAGAWVVNPEIANSMTPPNGTVAVPEAVNFHPAALPNDGDAYYPRKTKRELNDGWQTATVVGTNATSLLFKDDLIWEQKHGASDKDDLKFYIFDDYFNGVRDVILDEGTDNQRTLYDDIFRYGFIQSVDRVTEGRNDGIKSNWFVVFYNNGDKDIEGNLTEDSNRYFYVKKGDGVKERQNKKLHLLKDVDEPMNRAVMDNNGHLETFFKFEDGYVKYYFHIDDIYYSLRDGDDGGDLTDGNVNGPSQVSDGFPGSEGADAIIGKVQGYGRYRYIFGNQIFRSKGSTTDGVEAGQSMNDNFFACGEAFPGYEYFVNNVALPPVGVRNPAAANYGLLMPPQFVASAGPETGPFVIYDNGLADLPFPEDPLKIGTLSSKQLWKWNGYQWNENSLIPPRYKKREVTAPVLAPSTAGEWQSVETSIEIPANWKTDQTWSFYLFGERQHTNPEVAEQGIVWVDNVYVDFTYIDQSETIDVLKPYQSQILTVSSDGLTVNVDKSFKDVALVTGVDDQDPSSEVYDLPIIPDSFPKFIVSYINLNPRDLRTYLKFENDLFLTTNFKQDLVSVSSYPNSVVYKLYEPLPENYQKFDECIIVKEMADPLEETVNIVDFIPEEEPRLVLKSPDLQNVESPIKKRTTSYKSMSDILTVDSNVSNELRNEFLSQSLESVEINTDYSRYENFINFSSVERRIRNFKSKLENIEDYKTSSGSYVGVSGSSDDIKLYHYKIEDVKNNLDDFERYMYFESSSFVSGSLGQFYDNSWPKTGGSGTAVDPYVLAHTTSSQAVSWFSEAITSSSLYDEENDSKLSSLLPEFLKFDESNNEYLLFTDMIAQHFDHIWEYINSLSDVYDRRDKLDEGLSKELVYSVAKSMGWTLDDGKDLIDLPRFATGKEVTGSAYSDYSNISERDISREIWGRIVNNMPFFLKNKGTVRALKGLINIYGIPSTILRVKEYGGPNVPDNETPQFEIRRKFTKALDFRSSQHVKVAWANDNSTDRKPDTIELRFRAATGSNQILLEKQDANNQDFFIRLKDNGSSDNYGFVSFMLSGSKVGVDVGEYKEITSSALPIYDGDFYSVMVRRTSGSSNVNVSQSYELNVGKYDSSRSKIHLYSTSTMDVTQSPSASFSNAWTGSGELYIGGSGSAGVTNVGVGFSGSIMEYRHWTETLQTSSFKNHIANPKAYDGNTISSSYENLVLRYSFDDNKDLSSDTEGIRDVSANQTTTLSGSHTGFTGNFFRSVVDEQKTHIPSIGGLRRVSNKVRIEDNPIKPGYHLSSQHRATDSVYDTAPNDSNKVGIWFAPTDVINNDIINSVGDLNFDNYLGDPRDKIKLSYRGLNYITDNYWKKYTAPNNFWDYIRLIKYYDQSLYPQLRKLVPARAKPDIGLLIEPNIFERPKVIIGKTPTAENKFYSSSIDITKEVMVITGSYNHGSVITDYEAYTGKINIYSYETGSSVISSSGENLLKEASGSEVRDSFIDRSIWQRLGEGEYSNVTMSFGDTLDGVKGGQQNVISGSRVYGINQRTIPFYSSSLSASKYLNYSSSFLDTDLDNFSGLSQGLRNSFYEGAKNNNKTTSDGRPVIEVIISAPTKLVTTEEGDVNLTTGDGTVPDFKSDDKDEKTLSMTFEEKRIRDIKKKKKKGLKKLKKKPESDQDRKRKAQIEKIEKEKKSGKLIMESDSSGKQIGKVEFKGEVDLPEELEK